MDCRRLEVLVEEIADRKRAEQLIDALERAEKFRTPRIKISRPVTEVRDAKKFLRKVKW